MIKRIFSHKIVKFLIAIFSLVVLVFLSVILFRQYIKTFDPKFAWKFEEERENVKSVKLYGENKEFALVELIDNKKYHVSAISTSRNYIIEINKKERIDKNASEYKIDPGEQYIVNLYHLTDDKIRAKKIDIIPILKKHHIEDAVANIQVRTSDNNQDYLIIKLQKPKYPQYPLRETLNYYRYFHIDTGRIVPKPEIIESKTIPSPSELVVKMEKFDLFPDDYAINSTYDKAKNLSDLNIAKEEPELTEAFNNGAALYRRPGMTDNATWYNTIMHWFAPQGQDVMELYQENYDTGEKTKLNSYEDYIKWLKENPDAAAKMYHNGYEE